MSMADDMTASILRAQADVAKRKGLGVWPARPDWQAERQARRDAAKADAEAREREAAQMRERMVEEARRNGIKLKRVCIKPAKVAADSLAGRMRARRHEKGIAGLDMAARLGVNASMLSQWERGKLVPNPERLQRIANILGVTVKWLQEGKR